MVEEERWKRNGGSRMVQEKMCNRKEGINVEERRGRGNVYYLFSGECRTFSIELRRKTTRQLSGGEQSKNKMQPISVSSNYVMYI